jgi:hypothetical protein
MEREHAVVEAAGERDWNSGHFPAPIHCRPRSPPVIPAKANGQDHYSQASRAHATAAISRP